jgi:hypothetical protein
MLIVGSITGLNSYDYLWPLISQEYKILFQYPKMLLLFYACNQVGWTSLIHGPANLIKLISPASLYPYQTTYQCLMATYPHEHAFEGTKLSPKDRCALRDPPIKP